MLKNATVCTFKVHVIGKFVKITHFAQSAPDPYISPQIKSVCSKKCYNFAKYSEAGGFIGNFLKTYLTFFEDPLIAFL
jgi:hypothetical protein